MASGDLLASFAPHGAETPSAAYATLDARNGHPVLDFDATTDESAAWTDVLPAHYGGGGLTVTVLWAATSATTGDVRWDVQIERIDDGGLDTDADSFASAQSATATAPGTSGSLRYTAIAFTAGAQMDSLAANELFRLKVTRDANHAADTMTGDAELFAVRVRET